MKANDIEASVIADIVTRQAKGVSKYGQTVIDNPAVLREWLQHAYEECLDQAIYLKRAMVEMDNSIPKASGIMTMASASEPVAFAGSRDYPVDDTYPK